MSRVVIAGAVLASWLIAGCSGERQLTCEGSERYDDSVSAAPIRVPDDLSPPDESESLRIPPGPYTEVEPEVAQRPCLESPPSFFEEGVGEQIE